MFLLSLYGFGLQEDGGEQGGRGRGGETLRLPLWRGEVRFPDGPILRPLEGKGVRSSYSGIQIRIRIGSAILESHSPDPNLDPHFFGSLDPDPHFDPDLKIFLTFLT